MQNTNIYFQSCQTIQVQCKRSIWSTQTAFPSPGDQEENKFVGIVCNKIVRFQSPKVRSGSASSAAPGASFLHWSCTAWSGKGWERTAYQPLVQIPCRNWEIITRDVRAQLQDTHSKITILYKHAFFFFLLDSGMFWRTVPSQEYCASPETIHINCSPILSVVTLLYLMQPEGNHWEPGKKQGNSRAWM